MDNFIDSSRNVIFPIRSSTISSSNITRSVILITQRQLRQLVLFCRRAVNEINDSEAKQQLDTYLRALVPLEECLKSASISITPSTPSTTENSADHNHRHHHRKTNGSAQKVERNENIQFPEEVIVFTLESSDNDCPGMLPEEKVKDFDSKMNLF